MKKNRLYAVGFMLNCLFLSGQNNKAVMEINYEMKQIPDSTNRKNPVILPYTLLCNNEESVYFNQDAKTFYSTLSKNKDQKNWTINDMGSLPKFPKVRGSIYKTKDHILATLPIARDMYTFEEPSLKWEILSETKDIKGFSCQLAKTTTDTYDTFFAWFTKDIPVQEGPFRFKGLSGMILEVYNKNKTIEIYATEIKKSDSVIEPLYYGKVIELKSKDQYLNTRTNYLKDPSGFNNNEIQVTDMNGNNLNKKIDENIKKINVFLD